MEYKDIQCYCNTKTSIMQPIYSPTCVSWDFDVTDPASGKMRGNWTSKGCNMTGMNETSGVITCACNHLTNFAVLVVCFIIVNLTSIYQLAYL